MSANCRYCVAGLRLGFSIMAVAFAVQRWYWYRGLPVGADARMCGNCFMGAVGIPLELGAIGALLTVRQFAKVLDWRVDAIWWCCAIVGIIGTVDMIGVPIFLVAVAVLSFRTVFDAVWNSGSFGS